MKELNNYYIKTNRTFTTIRKFAWMFTFLVAIGGLWEPRLGVLVVGIMAGLLGTSFFSGRHWCGNFCPHGSLFDNIINPISMNKKIPSFLKSKWFIGAFFLFFTINFSRKLIRIAALWGSYSFIERLGYIFVNTYLMVLVVGGAVALLVNSRTWCQFCPMGTLQKLSYRLGKAVGVAKHTEKRITIESKDKCHTCGKCARVCPFQLTPYMEFNENNQFDNINCIKCTTCVENCPANLLSLETERKAVNIIQMSDVKGYENRQEIESTLVEINDLGGDLREFVFRFENPREVHYKAGQFILVKIQDNPVQYRAYSISSANEDDRILKVIIKKVKNGYGTEIIFRFSVGDRVTLEGPMGNHLVPGENTKKMLFIANGIGITPFIGLAKETLSKGKSVESVKLLNGQRYVDDFIYHDYFMELNNRYDNFEYLPAASREDHEGFHRGYVTELLKTIDVEGHKVYMCGSGAMIRECYDILRSKGVPSEDIFFESEERIKLSA
jgi:NAD(P)H-flavin reductase/ferredoxin